MARVFYQVVHSVIPPVARAVWRPTVEGLEHVPPDRAGDPGEQPPQLRRQHRDPVVVPRKVVFLAKSDYFTGTGLKGAAQPAWFEGLGMLPVDRDDTKAALASLDTALEVLGRGEAFGIYPEGTRSRDGRLYRGRTGVAHLALTAGVPGRPGRPDRHRGASSRSARDCPRLGRRHGRGSVSRSTSPAAYDGVPLGRARREVTDEIMTAIQALTGQEPAGTTTTGRADA